VEKVSKLLCECQEQKEPTFCVLCGRQIKTEAQAKLEERKYILKIAKQYMSKLNWVEFNVDLKIEKQLNGGQDG
jgi:hypothetical protein